MVRRICSLSDDEVKHLYERGVPIVEIARMSGLKPPSVSSLLDRIGVERRDSDLAKELKWAKPEPSRIWCGQCERNVLCHEGRACGSAWCKAKTQ